MGLYIAGILGNDFFFLKGKIIFVILINVGSYCLPCNNIYED
jgi:hypothetical protein